MTVSSSPTSKFIALLMDPLPDAELADPALVRLEKRVMRMNWDRHNGELRWLQANCRRSRGVDHLHDAHAAYVRQMWNMIVSQLAPSRAEVEWKRRNVKGGSAYRPGGTKAEAEQEAQCLAAIARDEARLGIAREAGS